MIDFLRTRPWGLRVMAVLAMLIHIPAHIWIERREIADCYRSCWTTLKTGQLN